MGETIITIKVYGRLGSAAIESLADTGATFTKIPETIAREIGLEPQYTAQVELSDGKVVERGLALAEVEIEGIKRPILIALSKDGERSLIGYTTLEVLGFKVNPLTRRLEKTFAIEY
jgi:clan AA aspartic protease